MPAARDRHRRKTSARTQREHAGRLHQADQQLLENNRQRHARNKAGHQADSHQAGAPGDRIAGRQQLQRPLAQGVFVYDRTSRSTTSGAVSLPATAS